MAKRKKRAKAQRTKRAKGKTIARKSARRVASPAKGKRAKRTLSEAKRKRVKGAQKVQATKPANAPAVETVVVDVIEEPGVITVTEFEETDIRDVNLNREEE